MSLILQIETATASCSVSLANNGSVIAFKEINERNKHAEVITLFINEVLVSAGKNYSDLDAVAVSCGPGSYTGLRIGVSVAKGLCFALDIPLIAIETLTAMAHGAVNNNSGWLDQETLLCPMIDARRMEVFTSIFNAKGEKIQNTSAEIINEDSFADLLQTQKMLFFGDGAEKCSDRLNKNANAVFLPGFINSATYLAQLADNKFKDKSFESVAYFEPFYLKDFIAGKKK